MLSAVDTIQRRDLAGRRTSSVLIQGPQRDSNNNAKDKTKTKVDPSKDLPDAKTKKKATTEAKISRSGSRGKSKGKEGKATKSRPNVDQKEPKKTDKLFPTLPSFKPKLFTTKVQPPSYKAQPAETYLEHIADEEVIVNKSVLINEEEEKNVFSYSGDPYTPPNFMKTVLYYQQVNKARITYLRAADCAGDLLLRGDVEGDADSWEKFLEKKKEDVRKWRKECDERHARRAKESRKAEEGEGTLGFTVRKIGRQVKMWMWNQFVDIFPCCVPE